MSVQRRRELQDLSREPLVVQKGDLDGLLVTHTSNHIGTLQDTPNPPSWDLIDANPDRLQGARDPPLSCLRLKIIVNYNHKP